MKKSLLTLLILLLTVSVCSAKRRKKRYSLRDSLRGGLSVERTCYDVHFYDLTVDFNLEDSSIVGKNTIAFNVIDTTSKIQLDLFQNLSIDSVLFKGDTLSYTRIEDAFFVNFPEVLDKATAAEVQVFYHGKPLVGKRAPWDGGFVWSKDDQGRPFVGVACEGVGASSWWPNKDHLSDKPDSVLLNFIVPNSLKCVANGIQQFSELSTTDTAKTHHQWKVQYPIVNYNVTFYLGNFELITDHYVSDKDSLLLQYYVLDYNVGKATKHFEQVKPMLNIYEQLYGKYPFWEDGYKLVDAPYLGMEHQSAIAYGNQYKNGYLGKQMNGVDFDYVIIHETGHEYWGNNITMKDLADMWIHEAFCTYSEALYVEKKYGYETMLDYLVDGGKNISNKKPIIPARHVNQMGSKDMYLKGSLMLHLVRVVVNNDSLWFATLKGLQNNFAYKSVGTEEVLQYLKSNLGKKVMPYFEQYLRLPELPQLVIQKMKTKGEYIIRWSEVPSGFEMKVTLKTKKGSEEIVVDSSPQRFAFDKIKSKEPEVENSLNAFTVHYR
jgi:aminopeptidase N